MKICKKCNQKKRINYFIKDPLCRDGYRNVCLVCSKRMWVKSEKKRKNNTVYREKRKKYRHEHYIKNREHDILRDLKRYRSFEGYKMILYKSRRALSKKYNRELSFSLDEFLQFLKINYSQYFSLWQSWRMRRYQKKYAPSIDRIDNNKGYTLSNIKGYTLSNIQLISHGENARKSKLIDGVINPRNKKGQYTNGQLKNIHTKLYGKN